MTRHRHAVSFYISGSMNCSEWWLKGRQIIYKRQRLNDQGSRRDDHGTLFFLFKNPLINSQWQIYTTNGK